MECKTCEQYVLAELHTAKLSLEIIKNHIQDNNLSADEKIEKIKDILKTEF